MNSPSNWEAEADGSGVQCQLWLHSKFEASMGYVRLSQKTTLSDDGDDDDDRLD